MRFEESIDLFGLGMGQSTTSGFTCGICKKRYRESDPSDDGVRWTNFAGLEVAECCFEKIEASVLLRIRDIIPWFTRILENQRAKIKSYDAVIAELKETLNKDTVL